MAVMLVSQNNEMVAMLVSHANPVEFEVLSYVNASSSFNEFA